MKYHFKIHREGSGFWAECLEIPGCITEGNSKNELLINMEDAINTYLEEPKDSKYLAPLPKKNIKKSSTIVEVSVDPQIALAFSIRYNRIKSGMTQKQVAQKLGMNQIYSYQRLEKKGNFTLKVMQQLLQLFPSLSIDQALK